MLATVPCPWHKFHLNVSNVGITAVFSSYYRVYGQSRFSQWPVKYSSLLYDLKLSRRHDLMKSSLCLFRGTHTSDHGIGSAQYVRTHTHTQRDKSYGSLCVIHEYGSLAEVVVKKRSNRWQKQAATEVPLPMLQSALQSHHLPQ